MRFNEVVLKSSSQNPAVKYKVVMEDVGIPEAPELKLTCTCLGYRNRRQCRHVNEVAQQNVRQEPCPSCGATTWSETTLVGGANALICDSCDWSIAW